MTPERLNRIRNVLRQRQPDLTVITDEVHKPRNISAIVRTCDAVGIDTIHCVVPKEGYQFYKGASASAVKWVEVEHYSTVMEPVTAFKEKGYQLVAANLCEGAVDFRSLDYTKPTALVMGAEVEGISDAAQVSVDFNVTVPMAGMVESFNVSVACAIILMEAQRQRQAAGMYEECRLDSDIVANRFFRWAHPKVARYCEENKLPYPPVREDGEILEPSIWYHEVRKTLAKER